MKSVCEKNRWERRWIISIHISDVKTSLTIFQDQFSDGLFDEITSTVESKERILYVQKNSNSLNTM